MEAAVSCRCSELSAPPSPGSPHRRGTWCDGAASLESAEEARALLRAWVALPPGAEAPESPRPRRALSLPAAGGGGCCHKCKKRVQFADALGLRLETVKHFSAAEEPQVPPAVLHRLQEEAREPPGPPEPPGPRLLPDFPAPAAERLQRERLCLERVRGGGGPWQALVEALARGPGEARVRYTFNEWLSWLDAPPDGPAEEREGGARRLRFTVSAPPLLPGARLHFALCLREPSGAEHWDNNGGRNYTLRSRCPAAGEPE